MGKPTGFLDYPREPLHDLLPSSGSGTGKRCTWATPSRRCGAGRALHGLRRAVLQHRQVIGGMAADAVNN